MITIGILSTARIAPIALSKSAATFAGVRVEAVASRDLNRAKTFAAKMGIARAYGTYEELLNDPKLDAVYNPLPNSLHQEWTIRALEAGKHVLCEKPLANNAREAQAMADAAAKSGRLLAEAFHYRYHPLILRMKEILDSGELGELRHLEAHFCAPLLRRFSDIRYQYKMGGGATMDLGCYCVNLLRHLAGAEPEITSAKALLSSPQVDRYMEADFGFPNGATARLTCAMRSRILLRTWASVQGTKGEIKVWLPFQPQIFHRLKARRDGQTRVERFSKTLSYSWQLQAFAAAVRKEAPVLTTAEDAVSNMRAIDAIYTKAGLKPRGT